MTTSKITTKKLLVAYDPSNPDAGSGDFVVPINDDTGLFLVGLRSRKRFAQGRMVYIGKAITMNDVFAKLVDSGLKIKSVARTAKTIEEYLQMLQDYKIGNIIGVEANEAAAAGFRLIKIANMGVVEKKNLP